MMTVDTWREWKNLHKDFPLTVHPTGQWAKKVRGKVYYFGVLKNYKGALGQWLKEKDYLLAGVNPPTQMSSLTVAELLAAHMEDVDKRISAGKLSIKTRGGYSILPTVFRSSGLMGMPVDLLGQQHFAKVAEVLEGSGRVLRSQKNVIIAIRTVFNWGGPDGMGIVKKISFGPRFIAPSLESIESQTEETGKVRFFDRELILATLSAAPPKMKVAILLGINCGFYQGDTAAITLDHLHLDETIPYHDFRRVKTGRRRMAALWPETVSAIIEYRDVYRHPVDVKERKLLLTKSGRSYSRSQNGARLMDSFGRLVDKVGKRTAGVSLGSLRHTYATVIDSVPDQAMIDLTMGHTNKSIQKRTYRQLNLNELVRLKAIADVAREWVWPERRMENNRGACLNLVPRQAGRGHSGIP